MLLTILVLSDSSFQLYLWHYLTFTMLMLCKTHQNETDKSSIKSYNWKIRSGESLKDLLASVLVLTHCNILLHTPLDVEHFPICFILVSHTIWLEDKNKENLRVGRLLTRLLGLRFYRFLALAGVKTFYLYVCRFSFEGSRSFVGSLENTNKHVAELVGFIFCLLNIKLFSFIIKQFTI